MKGLVSFIAAACLLICLFGATPSEAVWGNYVRIYQSGHGDGWLQLSQLAVFDFKGRNVAYRKPTYSTSSWGNWGKNYPVDGHLGPRHYPRIFHSGRVNRNDFWQVDLKGTYNIQRIIFYNRSDCCWGRANGMRMMILDCKGRVVDRRRLNYHFTQHYWFRKGVKLPKGFNSYNYLLANKDVRRAKYGAKCHYLNYGYKEKRKLTLYKKGEAPRVKGGKNFVQIGDFRIGVHDYNHFSISHQSGYTAWIWRADGHNFYGNGYRRDYGLWGRPLRWSYDEEHYSLQKICRRHGVCFGNSFIQFGKNWRLGTPDENQLTIASKKCGSWAQRYGGCTTKIWRAGGDYIHGPRNNPKFEGSTWAFRDKDSRVKFGVNFIQIGKFRLADLDGQYFSISNIETGKTAEIFDDHARHHRNVNYHNRNKDDAYPMSYFQAKHAAEEEKNRKKVFKVVRKFDFKRWEKDTKKDLVDIGDKWQRFVAAGDGIGYNAAAEAKKLAAAYKNRYWGSKIQRYIVRNVKKYLREGDYYMAKAFMKKWAPRFGRLAKKVKVWVSKCIDGGKCYFAFRNKNKNKKLRKALRRFSFKRKQRSYASQSRVEVKKAAAKKKVKVAKKYKKIVSKWRGFDFYEVPIKGAANYAMNIISACKRAGLKTPCDHPHYRGQSPCPNCCTNMDIGWHHMSHPSHNRSWSFPVKAGYFWYAGSHGTLLNTGSTHRWATSNDYNQKTLCIKDSDRKPSKGVRVVRNWRGWDFFKVKMNEKVSNSAIQRACKANQMAVPCDHVAYRNNQCVVMNIGWHHMSYPPHNRAFGFPVHVAKGKYWYTGHHGSGVLQNTGHSHRWINQYDFGGSTLCIRKAKPRHGKAVHVTNYRGMKMYRVKVDGLMDAEHIRNACKKNGLKPICDHPHYFDHKCLRMDIGAHHMSYPPHNRHFRFPVSLARHIFWYTGPHHLGSLYNTGHTHRWRTNQDYNGNTMCGQRFTPSPGRAHKVLANYRGYAFYRVKIAGAVTAQNIYKACKFNKLITPCDHPAYKDRMCTALPYGWHHLSHISHNHATGFPVHIARHNFFYTGRHGHGALYNTGHTHRWNTNQDYGEHTLCMKKVPTKHGKAKKVVNMWRGYTFWRVKVDGLMDAHNIRTACAHNKLQTPCDHWAYYDGKCVKLHIGWHHMSYPPHNRAFGFPVNVARGNYWYTGHHGSGSLYNNGHSHSWRTHNSYNGYTMCVSKADERPGKAVKVLSKWRGFDFYKVRVAGQMTAHNIMRACQANKLLTPCDHPAYHDHRCVNMRFGWHHLSYTPHNRHFGFPQHLACHKFFFTGRHGHGALQNTCHSHRWANYYDYGQETLCVKEVTRQHGHAHVAMNNFRGFKLYKVKVDGLMTAANILEACKKNHLAPVCDHPHYYDGKCIRMDIGWHHMSHPSHNRHWGMPVHIAQHVFWYTGRHHTGSLYNTGGTHRWRNDNDYSGNTMCAKHVGHTHGKAQLVLKRWKGFNFYKVKVGGVMNAHNIHAACQKNKLKTPCDHPAYYDHRCVKMRIGNHHLSYTPHNRHFGFPQNIACHMYFFTGRHGTGSLQNTCHSHRWAQHRDYGQYTLCVSEQRQKHGRAQLMTNNFRGFKLYSVKVDGPMDRWSIVSACKANHMKPICDHRHYYDGYCLRMDTGGHHMSYPPHNDVMGINRHTTVYKFYYTGPHGSGSLYNFPWTHRWRVDSDYGGNAVCGKPNHMQDGKARKVISKYRGYAFYRVQVAGFMTAHNIRRACAKNGLQVPCDHQAYRDGHCHTFIGWHHLSYRYHNRHFSFPADSTANAFWYTGHHGSGSLQAHGWSHRWANVYDWGKDAMCIKKQAKRHGNARQVLSNWRNIRFYKVQVDGTMDNNNAFNACRQHNLWPICDHWNYGNGKCIRPEVPRGYHFSYMPHTRSIGFPAWIAQHTFWYAGNHHWTLYNTGSSHRWAGNGDHNGNVMCGQQLSNRHGRARKVVSYFNHYAFYRVKVNGWMNAPNIRKACAQNGLKPPCDHRAYSDGHCINFNYGWHHFSYWPHAKNSLRFPAEKTRYAYWYTGHHGYGSLQTTSNSHRWANDWNWGQDTVCVRRVRRPARRRQQRKPAKRWHFCAWEGHWCHCRGLVQYGRHGRNRHQWRGGWTRCTNGQFGDPIRGHRKLCHCLR